MAIDSSFITLPADRILPQLANRLKQKNIRFDVHCHLFDHHYIPDSYFHVRLPWLMKRNLLRRLVRILKGKKNDDDTWTQHASDFLRIAKHERMVDVAKELIQEDNAASIFCALTMDMTQAFGVTAVSSMQTQMDEMCEVRNTYPEIFLPFVCLDPNNPEMQLLFQKAFSIDYNFYGVKIYPLLGYLPNHPLLMEVFEHCERMNIPVTTHCGGDSTRVIGKSFCLPFRIYDSAGQPVDDSLRVSFKTEAEKASFFNHPNRWLPVLERFPKLRLNLAHFGGQDEWKAFSKNDSDTWVHAIVSMMEQFEYVFADISYTLYLAKKRNTNFLAAFEALLQEKAIVRQRTLYGSDYYMVVLKDTLPSIKQNLLMRLSDNIVENITKENPKRFLNLNQNLQ